MTITPETLWHILVSEAMGQSFTGLLVRRIHPDATCDLFLGVEEPGDQRALILQVRCEHLPSSSYLPEARGIEIRILPLGEQCGKGALILVLKEKRFLDIFQTLVRDLAEALAQVRTEDAAVELFLSRIRLWQRFLEVSEGDGLGEEAQRGLFGELWFLREHILPDTGPSGVSFWTGCARTPQDFQLPAAFVEVKTTLATHYPCLQIHGLRQLDDSDVPRLFLCHLTLINEGEGETLAAVVASIRRSVRERQPYTERFEALLLEAGYLDSQCVRYDQVRYWVCHADLYNVSGDFPRLCQCDVSNGVGGVNYTIEAAACRNYVVAFTEIATAFREG